METVAGEGVKVAFLPVGDSRIELLEASSDDSTVARFIAKRGEGLHHLTLRVDDLDAALERVAAHGVELLGSGARRGAGGSKVAFLSPRSTGGVLIELVEPVGAAERTGSQAAPAAAGEIGPGAVVLAYLREPGEKLWGVLRRLDAAGIVIEAIDLGSFDDWVAQVEREEESIVGPSMMFVPMARLEKLLLDRPSGNLPSMADRFRKRTGRSVHEVLVP
jgi:methylmalonyl-CoA/ethylmalonyl-CoA epimerase